MNRLFAITAAVASVTGASSEVSGKDLTLTDLVRQMSSVLNVDSMVKGVGELEQESVSAESHVLGATEVEFEGVLDPDGKPLSRQLMLRQPVRVDFSAGSLKKALGHESAAHVSELMQEVSEATAAVAERLIALQASEEQMKVLTGQQSFLQGLVQELNKDKVANDRIFTSQLSLKLSMLKSEIGLLAGFITSERAALQQFGVAAGDRLRPGIKDIPADAVARSFTVRQLESQAAAAAERAAFTRRHFEFDVALGAEYEADAKDPSYLMRLSAPIGQVHANKHENSRLLREKSLHEDRAKLRARRLQQELSAGIMQAGREQQELQLIEAARSQLETTYQVADDGYRRGLVPVDRLHDLFDQVTDMRIKEIEARKHLDGKIVELFFLAGGWQ